MLASFMVILIKTLVVIVIIIAMIVILLGINHLGPQGRKQFDDSDTDKLRSEVEKSGQVISRRNLFHQFLSDDKPKRHRRRDMSHRAR